jgi:hypothetical protein
VQLLGEVARGHWGLGTASVADVTAHAGERPCAPHSPPATPPSPLTPHACLRRRQPSRRAGWATGFRPGYRLLFFACSSSSAFLTVEFAEMTEDAIAAAAGDMDAMQESVRAASQAADTRPMEQG